MTLSGCASLATPSHGRGRAQDPRSSGPDYVACLRSNHLTVVEQGYNALRVGTPPSAARVVFEPTAGIAEGQQIEGRAQGAEVIGAALLYPNGEPGARLTVIENCLGQGVKEPKE